MNWLIMGSYTCSSLEFILYYTDALFCILLFKQLISSLMMRLKPTQIKNMILK